jgi:hypothetical protein
VRTERLHHIGQVATRTRCNLNHFTHEKMKNDNRDYIRPTRRGQGVACPPGYGNNDVHLSIFAFLSLLHSPSLQPAPQACSSARCPQVWLTSMCFFCCFFFFLISTASKTSSQCLPHFFMPLPLLPAHHFILVRSLNNRSLHPHSCFFFHALPNHPC